MTKEELIRMAREAGLSVWDNERASMEGDGDALERFAALVAAAERKRFAEECIDLVALYGGPIDLEAAIRARGETK